jgi:tRNA modification GTPase TrmE
MSTPNASAAPIATIAAIATAPGAGGIGIVRLSGSRSEEIAAALTGKKLKNRFAHFAAFRDEAGEVIDRGLAVWFRAPHSFTGEDVVELHAHGSAVVLDLLLRRALALGARQARAGEFSERAFLNGKLDLAQAEAIADLIASGSEAAARAAMRSLDGEFSRSVRLLFDALVGLRSWLEAALDFPEEEIDFLSAPQLDEQLAAVKAQVAALLAAARRGLVLRDGLHVVIVGRPNVGKSSLFNRLLGEERSLTGPEAGITRDAVVAKWQAGEREILLHDTAGLRKRARAAGEVLEQMSIASTNDAIRFAECVVVVIDALQPFEKQDLTIADMIETEGRAIVFAINKWDLVENKDGAITALRKQLDQSLPQLSGAPLISVSAKTGQGLNRLIPAIAAADKAWNTRISTGQLNRFLETVMKRNPPPAVRGRRVRIRYMTQPKARPPTFALFGTQLNGLPDSYLRYLRNMLREAFDLGGAPLRFSLRTSKNPYAGRE